MSRAAGRFACLLSLAALATTPVVAPAKQAPARAQVQAGAPSVGGQADPWLYRKSDIPHDAEWQFGELSNGLRYAVRHNGVPPGQVSIRIRIDAGSLYERPAERGFAHLIEHLTFRQSKYLAEAQAIPVWERLGASFGTDTNAETTPTQTVYKLDLPDAQPVGLEESFKLLSGMIAQPTLSEANVRTEVPIVLAEKRERGGTAERVQDDYRNTYYAGQLLAERPVIGTVETLQNAHQDAVRAFHARWYRPENTVIAVAGDIDPARLELLIRKWFSDWKGIGAHVPAPSFGDPHAAPGAADARAFVEPDLPRSVNYTTLRPWRQVNDNIAYNQGLMIDSLSQQLINRRLEARARGGGSYLTAQVGQNKVSRSADATTVEITPLSSDWRSALRDVRAVIADAQASPPTQEEIDREVAEMEVAFQVSVEQRQLMPGGKLADDLVNAVDIRETVASPEVVLDIFRKFKPLFTPAAVLAHTRNLFAGTVTRALLMTPTAGEGDALALGQAMRAPVVADGSARLAAKPISFAQLPALGTPAAPLVDSPLGLAAIERLEWANGVKALLWSTRDEPGRVTVKVRFGAGYRAFAPPDAAYIALGKTALVSSGVGELGAEELDRISTGRKLGFDFDIGDGAFTFTSETRPADLADQLYLFAAKLSTPRWDANPVERGKAAARIAYQVYDISPQGVLDRDMQFYQRNRDPRFRTSTPEQIAAATPAGFRRVWEPILTSGPVEIEIYGDFDQPATIAVLNKTFGALATRPPLPVGTMPPMIQIASGVGEPVVLTHRGAANQAAAVVSWPSGAGTANSRESRQLELLTALFTNRLLEAMREKAGASYAPQVVSSWPRDLTSGGSISALAQIQPEQVSLFFRTAQEIAADLAARPASADELARVTEPMKQKFSRASVTAVVMWQLEGATQDPSRVAAIRSLMGDFTETTPAAMQELARRYLVNARAWKLAVLPQGKALAAK